MKTALVVAALAACHASSGAQSQPIPQPTPAESQAAMFVAMGAFAYAECINLGYSVNPSGWHALVQKQAPGSQAKDFARNGRLEAVGQVALGYVKSIFQDAGAESWCRYMAAWAKAAHPIIWKDLIRR